MRLLAESITLRDATAEDLPFLADLYQESRREEVSAWGWPQVQQEQFLRMQFDAQRRSYRTSFPDAADRIVCREDTPVGRMLVGRESTGLHLIDIALLAEHRNRGIGTLLLHDLLKECQTQRCSMYLQVLLGNSAIHLYERLGFRQIGSDFVYLQMEWNP
jgi:ribosomal protein S18 acetylase RimI-like enzyme